MDTGMEPDGWYCVVVLADGTTSLYTSALFGVIGAGAQQPVRDASQALLEAAPGFLALLSPVSDTAVPAPGLATIRALTPSGQVAMTAPVDDLGNNRHPASPLFHAVHAVVTRIREATPPD